MGYNQNKDRVPAILLTGGHGATTGIAVIETLKKTFPKATISWIGTNSAISGSDVTPLEYKTYPSLGVKYYSINAGKLQTKFTRYTIPLLLLIPIGFFETFFLMIKIKPKVILSFGGYSSFPVVFFGWCFGIPIILHEQTVVAGRASMASAVFATKVALSRSESLKYFPANKCLITGNPLMSSIIEIKPKNTLGKSKTLLVMGGSRGSEFINEEIFKIRKQLEATYKVIHITGERDYSKYNNFKSQSYRVLPFINPVEMASIYSQADVIVSRAGANSVAELLSIKRPSILIPLPKTFLNEQVENAKYAEKFGIAKVMLESEVNSQSLLNAIESAFSNWQNIVVRVSEKKSPDTFASEQIAKLLTEYL